LPANASLFTFGLGLFAKGKADYSDAKKEEKRINTLEEVSKRLEVVIPIPVEVEKVKPSQDGCKKIALVQEEGTVNPLVAALESQAEQEGKEKIFSDFSPRSSEAHRKSPDEICIDEKTGRELIRKPDGSYVFKEDSDISNDGLTGRKSTLSVGELSDDKDGIDNHQQGESKEKEEAKIHSSVSPEDKNVEESGTNLLGIEKVREAGQKAETIAVQSKKRQSPPPSPREGCLASGNRNILLPPPELRTGHALEGSITDISEGPSTPIPTT
jgi:hypothetical protein